MFAYVRYVNDNVKEKVPESFIKAGLKEIISTAENEEHYSLIIAKNYDVFWWSELKKLKNLSECPSPQEIVESRYSTELITTSGRSSNSSIRSCCSKSAGTSNSLKAKQHGYFKANILLWADTVEELEEKLKNKRIPVPNRRNVSDVTEVESDDADDHRVIVNEDSRDEDIAEGQSTESLQNLRKNTGLQRKETKKIVESNKKNAYRSLLSDVLQKKKEDRNVNQLQRKRTTSSHNDHPSKKNRFNTPTITDDESSSDNETDLEELPDGIVPEELYVALKKKYILLKQENAKVVALNNQSQISHKKTKEEFETVKNEVVVIRQLNVELQQALLKKINTSTAAASGEDGQVETAETTDDNLDTATSRYRVKDNRVFLGGDVWLEQRLWDAANSQIKCSLFLKSLVVSVFGEDLLLTSSVAGCVAPVRKGETPKPAKPALPPETMKVLEECFDDFGPRCTVTKVKKCKKFKDVIREKIQDMVYAHNEKMKKLASTRSTGG